MPQPARLVVFDMAMGGSMDIGLFSKIVDALSKHQQLNNMEGLERFLNNPSGIAVAIPQHGSGFDLEKVSQRAAESCVAIQHLTLDGVAKMRGNKSIQQVIEQLGL